MEPAKIDWKNLEWRFVEDELYEDMEAPKWFDFLSQEHGQSHDDEAWFCRPDCNHPNTPQHLCKSKCTAAKLAASPIEMSPFPFSQRDPKLKRFNPESENQDPNNAKKETVLTQITEFCNDLKKMAIKSKTPSRPLLKINRGEDQENKTPSMPMRVCLNSNTSSLLQIRTNPPSPQCFSATKKTNTPSKSNLIDHLNANANANALRREAKALDVFWFLKPCTSLSTYNTP